MRVRVHPSPDSTPAYARYLVHLVARGCVESNRLRLGSERSRIVLLGECLNYEQLDRSWEPSCGRQRSAGSSTPARVRELVTWSSRCRGCCCSGSEATNGTSRGARAGISSDDHERHLSGTACSLAIERRRCLDVGSFFCSPVVLFVGRRTSFRPNLVGTTDPGRHTRHAHDDAATAADTATIAAARNERFARGTVLRHSGWREISQLVIFDDEAAGAGARG